MIEYRPDVCYVKFGEAMYIDKETDKKAGIERLEDVMATLMWSIWEMFPKEKRNDRMKEEFEQLIQYRINEYSKIDMKYEMSVLRKR